MGGLGNDETFHLVGVVWVAGKFLKTGCKQLKIVEGWF